MPDSRGELLPGFLVLSKGFEGESQIVVSEIEFGVESQGALIFTDRVRVVPLESQK